MATEDEEEEKKAPYVSTLVRVISLICCKCLVLVIIRIVNIQLPLHSHFILIVRVDPPHGSVASL